VDLARTLRQLVDRGVSAIVMETSSHALHQGRVEALRFDVAVFTNLSRDHLDYHGTVEAYLEAKLSLCDLLRADGVAVVNADDPAWASVAARAARVIRFGLRESANVRAVNVRLDADGARFDLVHRGDAAPVTLPLLGEFNVHNALGAAASALAMGFTLADVVRQLATIPQVPGRLERIADEPCPVLRDYSHTPDALGRALEALRPLVSGRLIVVFGAGGDRDRGKRPLMGAVAERAADIAIVTSDNPRTEDPDAIIDEIEAGMSQPHVRVTDRRSAIAQALRIAKPDDLILLAGKGHETYQVIGRETRPFDEHDIVHELWAERGTW
jgi:UDP-N-acetylmuramoyl-L-alanyl-D-glutamate--2,6-diaminopimelate ligase